MYLHHRGIVAGVGPGGVLDALSRLGRATPLDLGRLARRLRSFLSGYVLYPGTFGTLIRFG